MIKSFTFYVPEEIPNLGRRIREMAASRNVDWELGPIGGQINHLEGTTRGVVDDFNYVSRVANDFKFTIWDLQLTLKDLQKDLA